MMTSGSGMCLAQIKTVLFESVLTLVIWLDVYDLVKYLCSCTFSEPCNQISMEKNVFSNDTGTPTFCTCMTLDYSLQ